MIQVMDSIPWVRCGSGNVFFPFTHGDDTLYLMIIFLISESSDIQLFVMSHQNQCDSWNKIVASHIHALCYNTVPRFKTRKEGMRYKSKSCNRQCLLDIQKNSQKAFFLRLRYFCHTLLQKLGYMQMSNLCLIICFNFWYRHRPSRNGICISEAGHSSHQGGGNDITLQAIHLLVCNATDNWFIIDTREGTNRCEGKGGQNTSVLVLSFKLSKAVQIKLRISLFPSGSSCRLATWIFSKIYLRFYSYEWFILNASCSLKATSQVYICHSHIPSTRLEILSPAECMYAKVCYQLIIFHTPLIPEVHNADVYRFQFSSSV